MRRSFALDPAATGKRLPVATHLALHERKDAPAMLVSPLQVDAGPEDRRHGGQ